MQGSVWLGCQVLNHARKSIYCANCQFLITLGSRTDENASDPVPPRLSDDLRTRTGPPINQIASLVCLPTKGRSIPIYQTTAEHIYFVYHSKLYTNSQSTLLSPIKSELMRDLPLSQVLRRITGNSILLHLEEWADLTRRPLL